MNRCITSFIITVIFISCAKEGSNEFFTDPNNPLNDTVWRKSVLADAPVHKIFERLTAASETDSFDAATGGTLHFDDDLQITFPVSACGSGVSGMLKVDVDYLKTKGDMIRFGKPTTSNNRLLKSGGAFNIRVSQNGQSFRLERGKYITIKYKNAQPDSAMSLFYGDTTVDNTSGFTWVPSTDTLASGISTWQQQDTLGNVLTYGYNIIAQKLNWINCDKFADTTNSTTFSAVLPVNFTNSNTAVFIVFKDVLSVAQLNADVDNHLFFFNNVPVNSNVTIVSLSQIGNDLYLGTKQATVTANLAVEVSPEKKTKEEIDDYLTSL